MRPKIIDSAIVVVKKERACRYRVTTNSNKFSAVAVDFFRFNTFSIKLERSVYEFSTSVQVFVDQQRLFIISTEKEVAA